eukprot:5712162-Pyramimonas_sp.AAC.1
MPAARAAARVTVRIVVCVTVRIAMCIAMSLFSFCFCFSFFSPEPDDGRVLHDVEGHAPHQHAGLVPEGGGVCEAADVEVRAIPFALSVHPRR